MIFSSNSASTSSSLRLRQSTGKGSSLVFASNMHLGTVASSHCHIEVSSESRSYAGETDLKIRSKSASSFAAMILSRSADSLIFFFVTGRTASAAKTANTNHYIYQETVVLRHPSHLLHRKFDVSAQDISSRHYRP